MLNKPNPIEAHTRAFPVLSATDLMHRLRQARLIGFGENPHGVKEYFPIVRSVVQGTLSRGKRVLVLLEHEYWLNAFLDDFLRGGGVSFLSHSFHDPDAGVFYGTGLHQFYADLRALCREHPGLLSCRHIDLFLNPLRPDRSELVRSIDHVKWETSRNIKRFQQDNDLQRFAEAREQFLTQEAIEGHQAFKPDVTVLLAGSHHAGKKGGRPLGDCHVRSVMARFSERIDEKAISIKFAAIEGEFARLAYRDKRLAKIATNCDEWGQEDIQIEFKETIRQLHGNAFITDLSNMAMPDGSSVSYTALIENYDHLMTLRHVSADMPLDH